MTPRPNGQIAGRTRCARCCPPVHYSAEYPSTDRPAYWPRSPSRLRIIQPFCAAAVLAVRLREASLSLPASLFKKRSLTRQLRSGQESKNSPAIRVNCKFLVFPLRRGGERLSLKNGSRHLSIALYQQRANHNSLKPTACLSAWGQNSPTSANPQLQKNKLSRPNRLPLSNSSFKGSQSKHTNGADLVSLSPSWASQCFGRKSPDDLYLV